MVFTVEAQVHIAVNDPLPRHALANTRVKQRLARTRLEDAGPDPSLQYSRLRFSRITFSMPCSSSRRPSSRPAGPAPTIAT